jgi:hypothetical protein
MCGNSQAYDGARGEQAGADGHVGKPWDTQVMLDKVAEVLARAESEGAAKLGEGMSAAAVAATVGAGAAPSRPSRAPTPPPVSTAAPLAQPLGSAPTPQRTPGMSTPRAPSQGGAQVVPPGMPQPPRSATIMGMPTFPLPPASEATAVTAAPAQVPPVAAQAPMAPPTPSAPPVRATGSSNDGAAPLRAPMIKGTPQRRLRLVPISEVAAQVAGEHGIDLDSVEMQALVKLSREVVERIVWEVVPDLAEAIIKHNLDKLTARAGGR